jgi:hypothetical protein
MLKKLFKRIFGWKDNFPTNEEKVTLWVARDRVTYGVGNLQLFRNKPTRKRLNDGYLDTWQDKKNVWDYRFIWHDLFHSVTFENSPQKVELKLVKE